MPSWRAWRWRRCCSAPSSEHHWLRMCYARLGHLFPYLPTSPAITSGSRPPGRCWPRCWTHLARECPSWHDPVRLIDATPVPCGASRETVKRSELAGWAGYGSAPPFALVLGLELYLVTTPDGMPVVWCLGQPEDRRTRGGRRAAGDAGRPGALQPGLDLIGDGLRRPGLRGPGHRRVGMCLVRPEPAGRGAPAVDGLDRGWISRSTTRSRTSSTWNATAPHHRRPVRRIAQRLLAMAAAIWHNSATRPVKRSSPPTTTEPIRNQSSRGLNTCATRPGAQPGASGAMAAHLLGSARRANHAA